MKTTVNDVMTTRVIWVKKDATFRHVQGVVAVRDRLNYPPLERTGGRYDVVASFPMD
jgi:hypothetical protein